jgi:hypothetical protein
MMEVKHVPKAGTYYGKKQTNPQRVYLLLRGFPQGGNVPVESKSITIYEVSLEQVQKVVEQALKEAFGDPWTSP